MNNKKYFAKMSSKGQVTIPSTVRDILNISDGDVLEFDVADNNISIRKKKDKCKFCDGTGKIEDKVCFICDGTGDWYSLEDISQKLIFNCSKYGIGLNIINVINKDGNIEFLKIPDISVNHNKFNYPEEIINECIDGLIILNLSNRGIKILNNISDCIDGLMMLNLSDRSIKTLNNNSYESSNKYANEDIVLLDELLKKLKSKRIISTIEEEFNPFMKIYNEFFNK